MIIEPCFGSPPPNLVVCVGPHTAGFGRKSIGLRCGRLREQGREGVSDREKPPEQLGVSRGRNTAASLEIAVLPVRRQLANALVLCGKQSAMTR